MKINRCVADVIIPDTGNHSVYNEVYDLCFSHAVKAVTVHNIDVEEYEHDYVAACVVCAKSKSLTDLKTIQIQERKQNARANLRVVSPENDT